VHSGSEMIRLPLAALPVIAACSLWGCAGEPASSAQPTTADFEVFAISDGQRTGLPATSALVVVETAWFWADEITLVGDRGRVGDHEQLDGERMVQGRALDLAAPMRIAFPDAPPGLYSGSVIDLEPPDEEDSRLPTDLRVAYRITGRTSQGVPFTIRDRADITLDLRAGDGVELGPGHMLGVAVRFDLDAWWNGIDLGALAAGGPVTIDGGPLLLRFRDNLIRSASLSLSTSPTAVR